MTAAQIDALVGVNLDDWQRSLLELLEVAEVHRPALEALLRASRRAELRRVHSAYRARRRGRW